MDASTAPFTIAFVAGVTLTKWTSAWAERFPHVPLAFLPVEPGEQVGVLAAGLADVGFVRLPVETAGLSLIPLYAETPVVVLPAGHPLAELETVDLADLAGEDRVELPSTADAVELVAAGGGVLLVPQSIARLHARKDVVTRPVADGEETRIAIAWIAERTTERIEEFVGIVRGRTARSSRGAVRPESPPRAEEPRRTANRVPPKRVPPRRRRPRQGR
ncbi:MAG TPA: LysR family substrate-binding domain-containing protein [Lacisediminihabitans sp.]|uniref:LysR family substrate-binding domain-containing protein n=1 Tax=Lacisediminihabitans sp. TaxID=2787631 RepID=UPI002ED7D367